MDINVTVICATADRASAESLAEQFPGGAGTFSVPLATTPGVTDLARATHWAGSGYMGEEMVQAFTDSAAPVFIVMSLDGKDFAENIASCDPVLYRVYPIEVV